MIQFVLLISFVLGVINCTQIQSTEGGPGGSSETTAVGDSIQLKLALRGTGPWSVKLFESSDSELNLIEQKTEVDPYTELFMDTNASYEVYLEAQDLALTVEIDAPAELLNKEKADELFEVEWPVLDTLHVTFATACGDPILDDSDYKWFWNSDSLRLSFISPEDGVYPFKFTDCAFNWLLEIEGDSFRWLEEIPRGSFNYDYVSLFFSPTTNWGVASDSSEGFIGAISQMDNGVFLDSTAYFRYPYSLPLDQNSTEFDNDFAISIVGKFNRGYIPLLSGFDEWSAGPSLFIDSLGYVTLNPYGVGLPESLFKSAEIITKDISTLVINANFYDKKYEVYWNSRLILDIDFDALGATSFVDSPYSMVQSATSSPTLNFFKDLDQPHAGILVKEISIFEKSLSKDQVISISNSSFP